MAGADLEQETSAAAHATVTVTVLVVGGGTQAAQTTLRSAYSQPGGPLLSWRCLAVMAVALIAAWDLEAWGSRAAVPCPLSAYRPTIAEQ